MNCQCQICKGTITSQAIEMAEKKVLPFIKTYILNINYNNILPIKYQLLLTDIFNYSQIIVFNKNDNYQHQYYTNTQWFLDNKNKLYHKFNVPIFDKKFYVVNNQTNCYNHSN